MREIKFRGISLLTGEFVYGSLIVKGYHAWIIDDSVKTKQCMCDIKITSKPIPIDFNTIGQSTGKKDTLGNEIYEGDIIECEYIPNLPSTKDIKGFAWKGTVKWGMGEPSFFVIKNDDGSCYSANFGGSAVKRWEVIGNIHQYPELLEVNP